MLCQAALILGTALSLSSIKTNGINHCAQYENHPLMSRLIPALAQKLHYSLEDFCTNERIADLFHEPRLVYHRDDNQYHHYQFVTIHYYEYSVEYQYDLEAGKWRKQKTYNTW